MRVETMIVRRRARWERKAESRPNDAATGSNQRASGAGNFANGSRQPLVTGL